MGIRKSTKRTMETSMETFLSMLLVKLTELDINVKEYVWDGLKINMSGDKPELKWILQEMEDIDGFLEKEEIQEYLKSQKLEDILL